MVSFQIGDFQLRGKPQLRGKSGDAEDLFSWGTEKAIPYGCGEVGRVELRASLF
jgi:hypothetical protein